MDEYEERFVKGELSKEESDWYAFARSVAQVNLNTPDKIMKHYEDTVYNTKYIKDLLKDIDSNIKELQALGNQMAIMNGMLKEMILYKSNQLLFYHFLIPKDIRSIKTKSALEDSEYNACVQFDKFNFQYNASWMMEECMKLGTVYTYFEEFDTCYNIFQMPNRMCEVTHMKDGLLRYSINLAWIDESTCENYPKPIQRLWRRYKKGTLSGLINECWYPLGDHAYAFSLNHNSEAAPYYMDVFLELCKLEELKEVDKINAYLSATRLLVQKVPTDDKGKPTMPKPMVSAYHEAFKRSVSGYFNALTTPMEVDSVSIGVSRDKNVNYVDSQKDNIYSMAGINDEVFNGAKSSNEAIVLSNAADSILGRIMLRQLESIFNCEMKLNSQMKSWGLKVLETTDYTKNNERTALLTSLATYGSKKQYLALWGYTPLEAFNLIRYEDMADLEQYMYPMGTAYTQSSSDTTGGRPSNAENPESTQTTSEGENS